MLPVFVDLSLGSWRMRKALDGISAVYLLTHKASGDSYVGASRDMFTRAQAHKAALRHQEATPWLRRWKERHAGKEIELQEWQLVILEATGELRDAEQRWFAVIRPQLNTRQPVYPL